MSLFRFLQSKIRGNKGYAYCYGGIVMARKRIILFHCVPDLDEDSSLKMVQLFHLKIRQESTVLYPVPTQPINIPLLAAKFCPLYVVLQGSLLAGAGAKLDRIIKCVHLTTFLICTLLITPI
jgi:hypothetical protein